MRIDSSYFEGKATTTQRGIWDLYRSGSWREDGRRGHPTEKVKLLRLIGSHVGTGRQQQSLRSGEFGNLLLKHHLASTLKQYRAQWACHLHPSFLHGVRDRNLLDISSWPVIYFCTCFEVEISYYRTARRVNRVSFSLWATHQFTHRPHPSTELHFNILPVFSVHAWHGLVHIHGLIWGNFGFRFLLIKTFHSSLFMFKFLLTQIHDRHWLLTLHFHEYQFQTNWFTNTSTCLFMNWLDPVQQTLHWAFTFKTSPLGALVSSPRPRPWQRVR